MHNKVQKRVFVLVAVIIIFTVSYYLAPKVSRNKAVEQAQAAGTTPVGSVDIAGALQQSGRYDDTLIVFTSDNGFSWGEHQIFYAKNCTYEECIRVPLIMEYPRLIKSARQNNSIVANIDFAPTFADMAGVTPATPVNGMSLLPVIKNQTFQGRGAILTEHWTFDDATVPFVSSVRASTWKYNEYPHTNKEELYNLASDPNELQNVASDPANANTKLFLKGRTQYTETTVASKSNF